MNPRTNAEWVRALSEPPGEANREALQDLHNFLVRAGLVYLSQNRAELKTLGRETVLALAEDVAQEALLEIQADLPNFRGEAKFTTWACRFVINRAASELRRRRYRDISLDRLREDEPAIFQSLLANRAASEPEHLAEQRDYLALLQHIVFHDLSDRQREAVIGVHWQGRPMDDVAEQLGLDRNALYKLLHDARKRIKVCLLTEHLTAGDILAVFED
jgi:RNA polymerase sigma-70 factor (ECF subfamily)